METHFVWSDAWILLAIIYSAGHEGKTAGINAITAAADYINHAIPTNEELEGALLRLQHAGFIEERGGRFKPGIRTTESYARTTTPRRTALRELEDLKLLLNVQPG